MQFVVGFIGSADGSVLGRMMSACSAVGTGSVWTEIQAGFGLAIQAVATEPIRRQGQNLGYAIDRETLLQGALPSASESAWEPFQKQIERHGLGILWNATERRLSLIRDPFGTRSLFYFQSANTFYFATQLKAILAIPDCPIVLDPQAIHDYLTFSFVPGENMPIQGIRRMPPGAIGLWDGMAFHVERYYRLREELAESYQELPTSLPAVEAACEQAVAQRLPEDQRGVGLFLSGGIDSTLVGWILKRLAVPVQAFSLDFGEYSVESQEAKKVADGLGFPIQMVPVTGDTLEPLLRELVWHLELPFGDAVTGPLFLLNRCAAQQNQLTVFNGEGGDQFFGGWTNKPMLTAELFAGLFPSQSRADRYLQSYHRFHQRDAELYTPEFRAQIPQREHPRQIIESLQVNEQAESFLNQMRLIDVSLKGADNILPRMEKTSLAHGISIQTPLFDRGLAELAFRLPPQWKLAGATEKYILRRLLEPHLPAEIVWRRKSGMCVPITEWVLGPLQKMLQSLLGKKGLGQRSLFQSAFVEKLFQGEEEPDLIRKRRIGERIWTLAMLELWLQIFIDRKGQKP